MILDTNAISALAEQDKALTEVVRTAPRIAVTIISLGEYAFGISQSRHRAELVAWLARKNHQPKTTPIFHLGDSEFSTAWA